MPDCVAFLRGMNVGGHRIGSGELRTLFEELRLEDVSTFRASGNVIFDAADEPPAKLTRRIETGLAAALGYEVPVFLRTAEEIRAIAADRPFTAAAVEASKGKLQVALLSARPNAAARKAVLKLASDEDRLAFGERELYWLPSGGILDSELDLKAVGKLLGQMTVRTEGTVEQIAGKYFGD
jgi:uncharacterized protein (DUF1697 family)